MTGKEFDAARISLGLNQTELARVMDVHRQTIATKCTADEVEPLYRLAMLGLLATKVAEELVAVIEKHAGH